MSAIKSTDPLPTTSAFSAAGDKFAPCAKSAAIAPATCGAAIEVPEMVAVAVAPPIHAEVIAEPGAYKSVHSP